jgi:dihydroorotase
MSSQSDLMSTIEITAPADFHVHLRQPPLSALVTPHVREGGFVLAYVMVWGHIDVTQYMR